MKYFEDIFRMLNFVFIIIIISCNSTPKINDSVIDYLAIQSSKMVINSLGIDIYNKEINTAKQNIINEIIINDGIVLQDTFDNVDGNKIVAYIPKNNIVAFMEKIRTFGIVVNETQFSTIISPAELEFDFERDRTLLAEYESLLLTTNNIIDRIALDKEISLLQERLRMGEGRSREIQDRIENVSVSIRIFK